MKDNLFELLFNLFETSLAQIQKTHETSENPSLDEELLPSGEETLYVRPAHTTSIRVLTYDEQMKLTKASYQFLMRLQLWDIINNEDFELVLNQLLYSDVHIATLRDTKWTIRNVLATDLNEKQLAFLDLILYQEEDKLTLQ